MAIIVDNDTRLVVQGATGREGSFHTLRNRSYGTNVVAGVTPDHRVAAGANRDRVVPGAAADEVVAAPAVDGVVAVAADDRVVPSCRR